jgi:putative SOS response-associated peptidase YedK
VRRFTATFELREIKVRWNLQHDLRSFIFRYNIAPSQGVLVIVRKGEGNELILIIGAWFPCGRKALQSASG